MKIQKRGVGTQKDHTHNMGHMCCILDDILCTRDWRLRCLRETVYNGRHVNLDIPLEIRASISYIFIGRE